jgi:ATP-binding cassette subfamily B protein
MENFTRYADRPIAFLIHYVRLHPFTHLAILAAVVGAVSCSVSTQYAVKFLVDILADNPGGRARVWLGFAFLVSLIAGDNLLWRLAGWIASYTFVGVTGDVRSDLFRHLTGHAPSYFQERLPGMLTSRVTATSNAAFTVESMFIWNVLPPCLATAVAIAFLATVNAMMTVSMVIIAAALAYVLYRLAAAGGPLHRRFADRAAAVDGEMVDIIGNMLLVRAFGGLRREHRRFDETVGRELKARRRSLQYLEKLRLFHALTTIVLTISVLAWAIVLWQHGAATTGDVVLVTTLGFTILHASRDLAVALVNVTEHMARLAEAI